MTETLKIAIPMAGLGSRLRPHTWSKPKPLLHIAGRTVLDYFLDQFNTLPDADNAEYIFIVNQPGDQVKDFMSQRYPHRKCSYVLQSEMRGQSDALFLAREYLHGPLLMAFSDTLVETDLSLLKDYPYDALAWVKPVPDPRRFGVAQVNGEGWVTRLVEKPAEITNNLVVVGFYYFRSGEELMGAIDEQMHRGTTLKGEYFLADAINILLERGHKMRTVTVGNWLDAGTPDALLETNRYLLEQGHGNGTAAARRPGVTIIPPVYIHESAVIENSVIGPNVSVDQDCRLQNVIIRNSIVERGTQLSQMVLADSLIGRQTVLQGQFKRLNLGDNAWVKE